MSRQNLVANSHTDPIGTSSKSHAAKVTDGICGWCDDICGSVEELIPEMSDGKHSNVGTVLFAGFTVMMSLDAALR